MDGLPGIAPNLLTDRLRDLDATVRAEPACTLGCPPVLSPSATRAVSGWSESRVTSPSCAPFSPPDREVDTVAG